MTEQTTTQNPSWQLAWTRALLQPYAAHYLPPVPKAAAAQWHHWLHYHHLLPWLAHCLRQNPAWDALVPAEIGESAQQALQLETERQSLLETWLAQLWPLIPAEEGQLLLFKGPALANRCYPLPALRPYSDLDLLLPYPQAAEAFRLLRQKGFEPIIPFRHRYHRRYLPFLDNHFPPLQKGPLKLELHFRLHARESHHWHRRDWQWLAIGGKNYPVLPTAAVLPYLGQHLLQHFYSWDFRMKWLLDIHQMAQHSPQAFQQFREKAPPDLLALTEEAQIAATTPAIQHFRSSAQGERLPSQKEGSEWNLVAKLPKASQKILYLLGEMFPSPAFIRNRYGLKTWGLPLGYALRFFTRLGKLRALRKMR